MGPNGFNLADWDSLSTPSRVGAFVQALVAVVFVPFGLYLGLEGVWLGWVMAAWSVIWFVIKYFEYRELLAYRRAGG